MPDIHISDETFRRLQSRAVAFVDKPEDVIRRLLDATEGSAPPALPKHNPVVGDLVSRVGRIPAGSQLRAVYKRVPFHAEVTNGRVLWNGRQYDSLSSAAVAAIRSTGSSRHTENGWRWWEVRVPGDERWIPALEFQHGPGPLTPQTESPARAAR